MGTISGYFDFIVYQFVDALFTGLMLVAVIGITISLLGVRGISFKVEVDSGDEDRSDQ